MVPPDPPPAQRTSLVTPFIWLRHSCYLCKTPHWLHLKVVTRESSPVQHTSLVTPFIWLRHSCYLYKPPHWLHLKSGYVKIVTCTTHLNGYILHMVGYTLHMVPPHPSPAQHISVVTLFIWLVTPFICFLQTRHLHINTPHWLHLLYGWLHFSYDSTRPVTCTTHLTGYTLHMVVTSLVICQNRNLC